TASSRPPRLPTTRPARNTRRFWRSARRSEYIGRMISFIVPAHNEELLIGQALSALQKAGQASGELFEIIVVDDASTDRTAAIAREHGARVTSVNHRQIAATRNSGAHQARGEFLFFVDGDTLAT